MALDYATYISQIANLLNYTSTETIFTTMTPGMIDYAEGRCYRDLNLLYTQVTDATGFAVANDRNFALPTTSSGSFTGTFIIVDNVNVMTPSTTTSSNGSRNQVVPTSREFLDIVYPSGQTATGVPQFYTMASNTELIFGPSPDAAYNVEIVGIQRPISLSSGNSSSILSSYVPDLFVAASMVFGFGFQRDFGGQSDNPQGAASWEGQYRALLQSAQVEQMRAKFQSEGWTSQSPTPLTKGS